MLAALLLLLLQIADPAPDIVVTARPGAPPPARDAADHFTLYCFEANRLSHRSRIPDDDPDWQPVDAATRARLKATPDTALFALADPRRRQTLVLRIERLARRGGLVEERCTLILIGGDDHDDLRTRIAALVGVSPTQRHVGHIDGNPAIPGWNQWLWTMTPARRSTRWRIDRRPGDLPDPWVVVVDPVYYDRYDYVVIDLKSGRRGTQPISIASLVHIRRAGPRSIADGARD